MMTHAFSIADPHHTAPVWVLGDELRFLGSVSDRDLHVIDVIVPPGSGTPPHRHASIEIFRVAEGELTFGLFEEDAPSFVTASPGTVVTLPSMHAHNYANRTAQPARMTVVVEGQMHDFFRDVAASEPPPAGPPSAAAIAAIAEACRRHGIDLLAAP